MAKYLQEAGTREIIELSKENFIQSESNIPVEDVTNTIGTDQIQDGAVTMNKINWNSIEEVPITLLNGVTAPDGAKLYRVGRIMFLSATLTLPSIPLGTAFPVISYPEQYAPSVPTDYCCQMTGNREGAIYAYANSSPNAGTIVIEKIRQGYDSVACNAGWRIWVTQSWIVDGGNE